MSYSSNVDYHNSCVYGVFKVDDLVYIGSGKLACEGNESQDRMNHVHSGISQCFYLNRDYFTGVILDVVIIKGFTNREDAFAYEEELIRKLNPEYNIKGRDFISQNKTTKKSDMKSYFSTYHRFPKKDRITGVKKLNYGNKPKFTDLCKDFLDLLKSEPYDKFNLEVVFNYDDIFSRYYNLFLDRKVSYDDLCSIFKTKRYVRKSLISFVDGFHEKENTIYNLTKKDLSLYFYVGKRYSKKDIKIKLRSLYIDKGIKKTALATDLNNWFEIKPIRNSELGNGFEILAELD